MVQFGYFCKGWSMFTKWDPFGLFSLKIYYAHSYLYDLYTKCYIDPKTLGLWTTSIQSFVITMQPLNVQNINIEAPLYSQLTTKSKQYETITRICNFYNLLCYTIVFNLSLIWTVFRVGCILTFFYWCLTSTLAASWIYMYTFPTSNTWFD